MKIPFLRSIISGIVGGLTAVSIAACISHPKPAPPPQPPPAKEYGPYYFAIVTVPDAPCDVVIEGYRGGPQFTPNGFLYLGDKIPAYVSGVPKGIVQLSCTGFVPMQWPDQDWAEMQKAGNNFYTLTPIKPPRIHVPTKQELMSAQYTFQGLRASCPEYDGRPIPIFDATMVGTVSPACLQSIFAAHRNAGDQVIGVALSARYGEAGIIPALVGGRDWTNDLPGLHALLDQIIDNGFYIQLHLAMDGHSIRGPGGRYVFNDPVGWTYGCEWGNEFFPRLADALDDIHGYIRFLPGFDGVFYGCETADGQAIEMPRFAKQFKARWPDGVVGIEFNTGHIPFGEGGDDFLPGGRMWLFDMVFAEFDSNIDQDSAWQIIGRLQHRFGDYKRPSNQPAGDDDGPGKPPAYLKVWPGVLVCLEWDTYFDVRFMKTPAQVQEKRDRLRAMGCPYVG